VAFEGFDAQDLSLSGARIHVRGYRHPNRDVPVLLLLHGFPQTHFIWHRIVPSLMERYSIVCPDLRGYGDSEKPPGLPDHSNYAKRAMAQDMVEVMQALGYERFHVVGHDRGGRVAHRLALDHPRCVDKLCVIDISPTQTMYEKTDMAFARAYFHWFFLIQPTPLPETLMAGCAPLMLKMFLSRWGAATEDYSAQAYAEYERCWTTPAGLHGSCEDYRASASIDLEHDRQSDAEGKKIESPLLVLWGENGVVNKLFDPLSDWRAKARGRVEGKTLSAGHYIPEEAPDLLLGELLPFLA